MFIGKYKTLEAFSQFFIMVIFLLFINVAIFHVPSAFFSSPYISLFQKFSHVSYSSLCILCSLLTFIYIYITLCLLTFKIVVSIQVISNKTCLLENPKTRKRNLKDHPEMIKTHPATANMLEYTIQPKQNPLQLTRSLLTIDTGMNFLERM